MLFPPAAASLPLSAAISACRHIPAAREDRTMPVICGHLISHLTTDVDVLGNVM